jgi:CRP/FNR family cyclic AMP-dependent transcriptional regulator
MLMRRVLYILSLLTDEDIDWLVGVGERQQVAAGEVVVHEGRKIQAMYLVLSGRFSVVIGEQKQKLAELAAGEMVGEISLIDSRPPTATVMAVEPSVLLRVSQSAVNAKLRNDQAFAARLYKAIAVFLAQRLRHTVVTLGYGDSRNLTEEMEARDELDPELLDSVSLGGIRFNSILDRLSR